MIYTKCIQYFSAVSVKMIEVTDYERMGHICPVISNDSTTEH